MWSCKQTGSCLHRASAALSIFNSVRNSPRACGAGGNVWLWPRHARSTLKFADGLISLQNEKPLDGETVKTSQACTYQLKKDAFRDVKGELWSFLAAFPARKQSKISLPTYQRTSVTSKRLWQLWIGAKIAWELKLRDYCVANVRVTAEEQWRDLRYFKGPTH